jgi:hypothetical protein
MKQTLFLTALLCTAFMASAQQPSPAAYLPQQGEDLFAGLYNGYNRALEAQTAPALKKGEWRLWKSTTQIVSPDSNMVMQLLTHRTYYVAVSKDTILIYGDGNLQVLPILEASDCVEETAGDYYSYRDLAGTLLPYNWTYFAKFSETARRLCLSMMWYDKAKRECWANLTFCFDNDKAPIVEKLTAQGAADVMYLAYCKAGKIPVDDIAGTR